MRVSVCRRSPTRVSPSASPRGLRFARGAFIAFIDQDDFWHSGVLPVVLHAALMGLGADRPYLPMPIRQTHTGTCFPGFPHTARSSRPFRWVFVPPKGANIVCVWQNFGARGASGACLRRAARRGADDAPFIFECLARLRRAVWLSEPPGCCHRSQPNNVSNAAPFTHTAGRFQGSPESVPGLRHACAASFAAMSRRRPSASSKSPAGSLMRQRAQSARPGNPVPSCPTSGRNVLLFLPLGRTRHEILRLHGAGG